MIFIRKMMILVVSLIIQSYVGQIYSHTEKEIQDILGISLEQFKKLSSKERDRLLQDIISAEKSLPLVINELESQKQIMAERISKDKKIQLYDLFESLKVFLKDDPTILAVPLDRRTVDKLLLAYFEKLYQLGFSKVVQKNIEIYRKRNKKSIKKYPFFEDMLVLYNLYNDYPHIPFFFLMVSMFNKDIDVLIKYKGSKKDYNKKVIDLCRKTSFVWPSVIDLYLTCLKLRLF